VFVWCLCASFSFVHEVLLPCVCFHVGHVDRVVCVDDVVSYFCEFVCWRLTVVVDSVYLSVVCKVCGMAVFLMGDTLGLWGF
jgi:hypothetical protein